MILALVRSKPHKRERKRFTSDGPALPRGGGKPAGRGQACRAGASLQGGGKPRPYYIRAAQAGRVGRRGGITTTSMVRKAQPYGSPGYWTKHWYHTGQSAERNGEPRGRLDLHTAHR